MLEYMIENKDELLKQQYHIPHKTVVVWGEFDPLFPVEVGERLVNMIGDHAKLEVIKKTNHAPNMEKIRLFNRMVRDFLK